MLRLLCASGLLFAACASHDPQRHLRTELVFLKPGVHIDDEEREVRRVLAQRDLRVTARLERPGFVALGAATRDGRKSAVRVITERGVVVAEDAAADDLFIPGRVALLEHFGGSIGDYVLVAVARIPHAHDAGCVTLYRLLADGSAVEAVLDVSALGSRACVANLAPGAGRLRARIAWPWLHALTTPQLDAELAFVEPPLGQPEPAVLVARLVDQGPWLEEERKRLSVVRLARAPFSERHATGVARAAIARLAGQGMQSQIAAYRHAVHRVLPNSTEAEVVADAVAHMERGWRDPVPEDLPGDRALLRDAPPELEEDAVVIEPDVVEPLP